MYYYQVPGFRAEETTPMYEEEYLRLFSTLEILRHKSHYKKQL